MIALNFRPEMFRFNMQLKSFLGMVKLVKTSISFRAFHMLLGPRHGSCIIHNAEEDEEWRAETISKTEE